jgi:hypothetical protein
VVEGAPLLRAYRGKTPIEGSNPSLSATTKALRGPFFSSGSWAAQLEFDTPLFTPQALKQPRCGA